MSSSILELLSSSLKKGSCRIGQVVIHENYRLHHTDDDAGGAGLQAFSHPKDAVEIAKYDDAGNYRPLKSAPNLRQGWILNLANLDEVRLALDFLYPATLGLCWSMQSGSLHSVPLRQTLARQSGMYAVVKKITDQEVHELVDRVCNPHTGCLRHILWPLADGVVPPKPGYFTDGHNLPMLCAEACNLFIAEGRKVVKGRSDTN